MNAREPLCSFQIDTHFHAEALDILTISQLARRFGFSRSTLLYYDKIGILKPSARSAAGYRLYAEVDIERMERIQRFRRAGLPLAEISDILDSTSDRTQEILERRLDSIQADLHLLHQQQHQILAILGAKANRKLSHVVSKEQWVSLLRAAGMDDEAMWAWHREFEEQLPRAHQRFLESLNLCESEIAEIRGKSRS